MRVRFQNWFVLHFQFLRPPGTLFAWLISHQPAILFSQNKPATSNQPSIQTSTSHQPNEQVARLLLPFQVKSYPTLLKSGSIFETLEEPESFHM
jgi:hypothetical protein